MSELRGLQLRVDEIRSLGIEVAAVCVDAPERNREVVERLGLGFPILSDGEGAAMDAFGVRHPGGGPDGSDIARPATFFIENGVIRWRDLTDNWRIRLRAGDLVDALRQLSAGGVAE